MKKDSIIHIRFNEDSYIQGKKETLNIKIGLIKLLKSLKRYQILREEELNTKINIKTSIKELNSYFNKIKTDFFPRLETPKILSEEEIKTKSKKEKKSAPQTKPKKIVDELDKELIDIQNQLKTLE
jgi:hypothetical protein